MGKVSSADYKVKRFNKYKDFISKNKKKFWRFGAFFILVIIIIIAMTIIIDKHNVDAAKNVCSKGNGPSLLKQSGTAISQNDVKKLQDLVNQIQNIPNYQNDANCLYPVVNYYILSENFQKSNSDLNKLISIYNSKQGFSSNLGNTYPISTLKAYVSAIQGLHQNYSKGLTFSTRT